MEGRSEPDHTRVVEGVVVVVMRDARFLVIRRAPGTLAEGAWCFVGGAIEPGESQPQAAVREFREEVGGEVRPLRRLWEYTRPDGGLRLHWWLAHLTDDRLVANPAEVAEMRWCTAAELLDLPGLLESNRIFMNAAGAALADGTA
ncbi:MAG: NUDIX domain-containing protein [Phycisphaerae bacterium]|nr:NUDIX domain-containing protein [Phycisphaerae bacterium]MCZ2399503.1 NUDIX domain-containing protein [Phycisphaerae bacterium]